MKLLTKTTQWYLVISLAIFIIGGLIFYQLLHRTFYRQIDETLSDERRLVEETINHADSVPDFRTVFGHLIDVTILNTPLKKSERITDTVMYSSEEGKFSSYRHLFVENTSLKGRGYTINIYKPLYETGILIAEIIIIAGLIFIVLMVLLVFLNYFISRHAWIPFYRMMNNLSLYNIHEEKPLVPVQTNIHEFRMMNRALEKMSDKIRRDYLNLKEFNENAAHELQTPLAIIKSKLDLLIQEENITGTQLRLISPVYDATTRMSKLIQGLLLISKIENDQFTVTGEISLLRVTEQLLVHYEEMIVHKNITVKENFISDVRLSMNRTLAEILIGNLISNAINHNLPSGTMDITIGASSFVISNTGKPLSTNPAGLFERFRKSGEHAGSAGLGLSIVRNITRLYEIKAEYLYHEGIHTLKLVFP